MHVASALAAVTALCACAGGRPDPTHPSHPRGADAHAPVSIAWDTLDARETEAARWFLDGPIVEVREESGGTRRELVSSRDAAGAGVGGWHRDAGTDGAMSRELTDAASGARVVERATAHRAAHGALLFERAVEVVALPSGFELGMLLPLAIRDEAQHDRQDAWRLEWTVHGVRLDAGWGLPAHVVILGRDEATRISLAAHAPEMRQPGR